MFKGDFADTCAKQFLLMLIGGRPKPSSENPICMSANLLLLVVLSKYTSYAGFVLLQFQWKLQYLVWHRTIVILFIRNLFPFAIWMNKIQKRKRNMFGILAREKAWNSNPFSMKPFLFAISCRVTSRELNLSRIFIRWGGEGWDLWCLLYLHLYLNPPSQPTKSKNNLSSPWIHIIISSSQIVFYIKIAGLEQGLVLVLMSLCLCLVYERGRVKLLLWVTNLKWASRMHTAWAPLVQYRL